MTEAKRTSHFLPEESFQSWDTYTSALSQTIPRLRNRALARSTVDNELHQLKSRSENDMKKTLTWWDLMWFGIGAVIGAGIFVLTGLEANTAAGPGIVLSYAAAGFSAMLSVFCYTEFAVEIPVAGGSFAYLRVELGDFMAFIGAGNIILEYIIGGAAVARAWTGYFATLCNHSPNDFRIHARQLATDYSHLDPIAVGILLITGAIAVYSTRHTSIINWVASFVNMFVILFIIIAGLSKAKSSNFTPFLPFGVRGVFNAASVLFFAYLGFDAVATMAEETKNPGRDIPIGLVGSMTICTILYCLMGVTLCLMQKYSDINTDAPFSFAFKQVGWSWAQYLVALGALKGMTTVLLTSAVGQARYLTHIGRTHMIPPWFALVHPKTGTPVNATISMVLASCVIAFFSSLDVLSNLLSISTLFIFMLVAVALIVRRHYDPLETSTKHQTMLIIFILTIIGSSIGIAIYWAKSNGWVGYAVLVPIWFVATGLLAFLVPKARKPKIWGVPLVPWIPSLSIATNIFLLGSIDVNSFIRFGVWTGVMLVYYFFFGLHASYDTAYNKMSIDESKVVEEGLVRTEDPETKEAIANGNEK
ncbi:hypothetical protein O6H91_03G097900 [Diphasiastrum complanatum]|uniref:Uncharacterized protein n=2 Tax=Diphasiastrum complanatum TaxID=34168 RepID=A0ACC2E9R5_DIPCM|nr:hypothetical protein O6H91_03G097500 [Diphasiastrum complanatum]KAJ7563133.1 hypothetical protein O6H91_03G097900 [Diphasiastrum complanatum]